VLFAASLRFEDYHEKLEEDYLFPLFEKAGRLIDLTKVLRAQHQAGRRLTDRVTHSAGLPKLESYGWWSMLHEARTDLSMWPGWSTCSLSAQDRSRSMHA
jgi:hypothetical protein